MTLHTQTLAFFNNLGWPEMLIVGLLALLIFGRRLPEVGRSLGKGIVEFKKGLADTGDEIKEVKKQAESQTPRFESTESKKVESKKVESTASSSHE